MSMALAVTNGAVVIEASVMVGGWVPVGRKGVNVAVWVGVAVGAAVGGTWVGLGCRMVGDGVRVGDLVLVGKAAHALAVCVALR